LDLKNTGIPQGLSYSPLLASFYALELDDCVEGRQNSKSYRYLDDMVILCRTEEELNDVYEQIEIISKKLDLVLHPLGSDDKKTKKVNTVTESFEFLGVDINKDGIHISKDSIKSFKNRFTNEIINDKTLIDFPNDVKDVYKNFAGGWSNHYKNVCPDHYNEVKKEIEKYLKDYIEKDNHRVRSDFFKNERLTLEKPFIKIV
jgi:hypothetical protein